LLKHTTHQHREDYRVTATTNASTIPRSPPRKGANGAEFVGDGGDGGEEEEEAVEGCGVWDDGGGDFGDGHAGVGLFGGFGLGRGSKVLQ
jgi:hypothetical protein